MGGSSATEVQGGGGTTVATPYFPVAEPTDDYGTVREVKMVENSRVEMAWSTGLFSCHEDWKNAIMTTFLPCVTFGQIAEIIDEGETSSGMAGFVCCMTANMPWCTNMKGCKYRKKLRKKFNLVEEPFGDGVSHVFCIFCSLCQEFRELKNRGFDPSLGWEANLVAKNQNQEKFKAPPKNQTMCK